MSKKELTFDDRYDTARPYCACYVILRRSDELAFVLRKNTGFYDGYWGLPAGKLEYHETFRTGAVREALEEAGVKIKEDDLEFAHVAYRHSLDEGGVKNNFMHWVDIYFEAESWEGEPYNAEAEKAEKLEWLDFNNLPDNILPAQLDALKAIHRGEKYSENGWESYND